MKNSLITKKMIAVAFKELMSEKPFSKITIQQIMTKAKFRRQTFYEYFLDKYQLLEWVYQQDLKENVIDYIGYEEWNEVIDRYIDYLFTNKEYLMHAIRTTSDTMFINCMNEATLSFIDQLFNEIKQDREWDEMLDYEFSKSLFSYALVGISIEYIQKEELSEVIIKEELVKHILIMFRDKEKKK